MVASQFLSFLLSDVRNSFPAIKPEFESNPFASFQATIQHLPMWWSEKQGCESSERRIEVWTDAEEKV